MKVELAGHYGYGRIIRTMMPMVAMMVVTSVYSIVDGLFVSNYAGSTAFAAMNIVWPAIALLGAVGLMIGAGGSALVSKTLGEGDPDRANRYFTMLIHLSVIIGLAFTAVGIVFMPQLVVWLGAEGEIVPYAVTYGRIVLVSLTPFILQMEFQSFYMTAERPQLGTVMSIVSGLANIGLDALFVAVFGWGLTGAAVATMISITIGGLYPIWYFCSSHNDTQLRFVAFSYDWRAVAKSCSNGMSEFVGNIALNVIAICYNLQLMKYIGENGVDAYGIIMYLGFVFAAVFIGYNIGMTQVIAYNYGARNHAELTSLLRKSLVIVGVSGLLMTALAEVSAPLMARIFVGYNEQLASLTVYATRVYMLSFLLCGFNMFASAWFTALNNGIISAVAAFTRTLVFELASVFVLPSLLGIDGIWLSVSVAEGLAFILSVALIAGYRRRYGY